MKTYTRFGLLLGILGAGAALQLGSRAHADGDEPKAIERKIEIRRGGASFLGVGLEDVSKDDLGPLKLKDEAGVVVKSVEADSPAAKAGLKEGDVIVRYRGETVTSVEQFRRLVRETPPGRAVGLDVLSDGTSRSVTATLGKQRGLRVMGHAPELADMDEDFTFEMPEPPEPPEAPEAPEAPKGPKPPRHFERRAFRFAHPGVKLFNLEVPGPRRLGIRFQEISGQLADHFKVPGGAALLVTHVDTDGPAAKGGVKAGDILLKIDGKTVSGSRALRRQVDDLEPGREVTVTVQRDGRALDLKVKAGGERPGART